MHVRNPVLLPWIKTHRRARPPCFPVILIPVVIFCSGREKNEGKDFRMDGKSRNKRWEGYTKGFIIGQQRAGHGIKLSYAHLRIFYYHREWRAGERISLVLDYGARRFFICSFSFFLGFRVDRRAGERASERTYAFRAYFCIKLSTLTLLSSDFICNFKRRSIYE